MRFLSKATSFFALVVILAMGCQTQEDQAEKDHVNVVELTIDGLSISGPDEITPGWTTFRVRNNSEMTHFLLFDKMPDSLDVWDHKNVAAVFQEGMNLINAGDQEAAFATFGKLPAWYQDVVFWGGPGFIAPKSSFELTMFVPEGRFIIECYVKTNGVFHSYTSIEDALGMVHQLDVTGSPSTSTSPVANLEVSISSTEGIQLTGTPEAGEQVFSVEFLDQIVHESFLGHDVQLVRLDGDMTVDELAPWMNYLNPEGLETPAPALFLGGVNEMPAGQTAYFKVNLDSGRYALIAETPNAVGKNMALEFTVE
ncbi:hypothetical protein HQ496_07630 [bacterium]|nr:hypothetical protein [bacterium]